MPGQVYNSNSLAAPRWAGDFGGREHILPMPAKIDPAQFVDGLALTLVVGVAGAAANATSIPLASALTVALKAGTTLSFGAANSKKFAKLTADAAVGATSLTVENLPTALVSTDTAYYSKYGRKTIKSGVLVGRTYAERDANTAFGPAVDTDDEIYLVMFTVDDTNVSTDIELYRHNSVVYENYLPDWTTISGNANLLAKLRALYKCQKGTN